VEAKQETVELINQTGYFVTPEKKGPLLRHLIQSNDWKQVLVFTSSVYQADLVADKLQRNGIDARATHSKKSLGNRRDALTKFASGKLRVLVTTDLLSRGIDISFLPHVVNYELPRSPKDFVHRIGRTGRAENPGDAITFVTEEDKHHFRVIQKKMKRSVNMIDAESLDLK
jgi:ATP-dependent RNA helicase RhlE